MNNTVEAQWQVEGLDCAVLMVSVLGGHRCGYVRVPEEHPWHGLGYSDEAPGPPADLEDRTVNDAGLSGIFAVLAKGVDGFAREVAGHVAVHGGLTFSGAKLHRDLPEGWWFGFDCAHADDTLERWPLDAVKAETERLAKQLAAVEAVTSDA